MHRISIKTRLGLELFRVYRSLQTRIHELNYLFWECTLRCNLNCKHCGSDCARDSLTKDMLIGDFLKVLDEVASEYNPNKVMIAVTGGEPLLRKDLEQCGKKFFERGFPWGIVSNGFIMDEARLSALLNAGLRSVTISLDGLSDSHDWLRGVPGSFGRAVRAVGLCCRYTDLVFDVVTCVNKKNIHELSDIKKLLIGLGVKRWRLFTIFPKGRGKEMPEFLVSDTEFQAVLDFIAACRIEGIISASYGCEGFLGNYEGKVRGNYFFCRAGITFGSVLVDGNISACPSLRGDFIQGNIYKDSFIDCWKNRYGVMRNRSWARSSHCADCTVFKWCNGNGLHLRDEHDKSLSICHYKRIQSAKST